jgi:hypothetical protein
LYARSAISNTLQTLKTTLISALYDRTQVLIETQLIQHKTFGSVNDSDRCMNCKGEHHAYYYKGVDHWDIQHALIAKEANVNTYITFDRGFNKLNQYFKKDYEIQVK